MLLKTKKVQNQIEDKFNFAKIKRFFAKFWWAILTSVAAIVAILFFRKKKPIDDGSLLSTIQDTHNDFSDAVIKTQSDQTSQLKDESIRHKESVDAIKNKYDELKKDLDADTRREAEQIFEENKNDPDELAKKLAEVTGFIIILPKD